MSAITKAVPQNIVGTMYEAELPHYSRILNNEIGGLGKDGIRSGGYLVDTLEAALWCFFKHDNYRDIVLEAVNLDGDTDTTGIVAGSLAGMHYGLEGLLGEWEDALVGIDGIKKLCAEFSTKLRRVTQN